MFAPQEQSFEAWAKPSQEMFNYWISFFPTAPLFGVEWQFGKVMEQGFAGFAPMTTPAKSESAEPEVAPVAYERVAAPVSAPEPEVVEAPKVAPVAAPEPVAETADAPVAEEAAPGAKPKGLLAKAPADADDLTQIKGVGPGLQKQLNALGIYRFKQMAKFSDGDLAWVDENLSSFKGRCFRDDWVGQAKSLMA